MNKQIDISEYVAFRESYKKNKDKYSEKLKTQNIREFCTNQDILRENEFKFNLDLGMNSISNQYSTKLCWLYATLNFLKTSIAEKLNADKMTFSLSYSFLAFYDKLEKSNYLYQMIIDLPDATDFHFCDSSNYDESFIELLKNPFRENGSVYFALHLIKKYGVVPFEVMPETVTYKSPDDFIRVFSQKLRSDVYKLIEAKSANLDQYELKNRFLNENYSILASVYGEPPTSFDYTYKNIFVEQIKVFDITPVQFLDRFCTVNLDDYVLVACNDISSKPFYSVFERNYYNNIYGEDFSYLNLPIGEVKDLVLKQLKSGEAVIFSSENKKYRDINSTVLDLRLFDYEKIFGISDLTRRQAQESMDITSKHWLVFRGVQIENGVPVRWKVEDSRGVSENSNGYYVMNDNFFNHCVMFAFISKKHLSKKQQNAFNQKPIKYNKLGL